MENKQENFSQQTPWNQLAVDCSVALEGAWDSLLCFIHLSSSSAVLSNTVATSQVYLSKGMAME